MTPALTEHLSAVIPGLAAQLHRAYPALPAEDIAQEMWARAAERATWFAARLEHGDMGLMCAELRRAGWRACKEDDRYQRARKALRGGYSPADEQFYTMGLLRSLLPLYLDGGVAEDPPRRDRGRPGGGGLKSEHGDYLAMMIDIDAAMGKIAPHERRTLTQWFSAPQGDDSGARSARSGLASSQGLTVNALEQRVTRALRSLQKALGGDNPWRRPPIDFGAARR